MALMNGMAATSIYHWMGAMALGQFVSLLVTATGLTSTFLAHKGIDAPTSQSLCNYILLAAFYGFIYLHRKEKPQVSWHYYLLLAVIDVEANYAVVKAYQYTSLTSVMLLDCWTIPCVLLLTCLFLKTKYNTKQVFGAAICVMGLILVILSDVHVLDRSDGQDPVLGDILVILGSMLYAVSNVSEEFLIKKVDFIELMTFLGSFGAVISACQLFILEQHELQSIQWTFSAIIPFVAYALSLFLFYSLVPLLLKLSGSTMLNLSLLTSDMWAVAIRIFAYHQVVDWLYFIAFATVVCGLVTYTCTTDGDSSTIEPVEHSSSQGVSYEFIDNNTSDDIKEDEEIIDSLPVDKLKDPSLC